MWLFKRQGAVETPCSCGSCGGIHTLDEKGLTEFVYNMYEMYHCESIYNAFEDIDSLIETGKPAW